MRKLQRKVDAQVSGGKEERPPVKLAKRGSL